MLARQPRIGVALTIIVTAPRHPGTKPGRCCPPGGVPHVVKVLANTRSIQIIPS